MKKEEETGKTLGDGNHLQGGSGLFLVGLAAGTAFSSGRKRLEVFSSVKKFRIAFRKFFCYTSFHIQQKSHSAIILQAVRYLISEFQNRKLSRNEKTILSKQIRRVRLCKQSYSSIFP